MALYMKKFYKLTIQAKVTHFYAHSINNEKSLLLSNHTISHLVSQRKIEQILIKQRKAALFSR